MSTDIEHISGEPLGLFVDPNNNDFRPAQHEQHLFGEDLADPSPGVSVRIDSRRLALESLTDQLAAMSMHGGYQAAFEDEVPLYDGNEVRASRVNAQIDAGRQARINQLKHTFAAAYGLPAILATYEAAPWTADKKTAATEQARSDARSEFVRFLQLFEGPTGADNRDTLRAYLEKGREIERAVDARIRAGENALEDISGMPRNLQREFPTAP